MRNRFIYNIFIFACAALCALSCTGNDLDDGGGLRDGDGVGTVAFNVAYRPLAGATLGRTRSEKGDIIGAVDNIFIAWYRENRTLAGSCYLPKDKLTITEPGRDSDCETTTEHADFECKIPYGNYRIYAVANMGDLTGDSRIAKESDFRNIPLTWNTADIAANCQMSGYFRTDDNFSVPDADSIVRINRPNVTLHSWIRRAASKVTVAFDATRLNENIYIYIKSAQIMDIPKTCPLVDRNAPSSDGELWHEGDTIRFGDGDDYTQWLRLSCGRGANLYGSHANDAPSMFFYENMQGLHPNKHEYKNFESKDNVPYGTYVEVKGYYVNNSAQSPSYGNIVYRCMLGKNMTDDFNAERNTHYRLTLVFNKNANEVDWHIDYDYVPKPPEIVVPNPMYISYLPNRFLNIPVTVYFDPQIATVESLDVDIVKNEWSYPDHKYYGLENDPNLNKGYLSLEGTTASSVDRTAVFTKSKRFSVSANSNDPDTVRRFTVPVWTRPQDLGQGYSGNNYYVGRTRRATLKLAVNIKRVADGSIYQINNNVEVIQIERLVNPKGIWRKNGSEKPFRITLKYSDSSPTVASEFKDIVSDGPWSAKIIKGEDWVRIKDAEAGDDAYGTEPITGSTGSKADFFFKPVDGNPGGGCRFGLIEVRIHDNTCPHVICVSQGMGPVDIGGRKWHMSNVEYSGKDAENPVLEGSMFKFGSDIAFRSLNNLKDGYGFRVDAHDKTFQVYDGNGIKTTAVFMDVPANYNGFTQVAKMSDPDDYRPGVKSRVANYADYNSLTDINKYTRYYGVLYGDECEKTLDVDTDTNEYTAVGEKKGMRGIFVCEDNTGTHLFFPIGNAGHGRRHCKELNEGIGAQEVYGDLRYGNRYEEMPVNTAKAVPCLFDLWRETGAIYWYGERYAEKNHYGFDMNYFTMGFESYTAQRAWTATDINNPLKDSSGNSIGQSDACFVRRVYEE